MHQMWQVSKVKNLRQYPGQLWDLNRTLYGNHYNECKKNASLKYELSSQIALHCRYVLVSFVFQYVFVSPCSLVKFIYSEKATKFCEIFPLILTVCSWVKIKGKILQNFVAFSEYMNFKGKTLLDVVNTFLNTKSLLTMPSNVLPLHLQQIFKPILNLNFHWRWWDWI